MTAIMAILTNLAIMARLNMVLNMVVFDVYWKIRKNVGHPWKRNWKKMQLFKTYGQIKFSFLHQVWIKVGKIAKQNQTNNLQNSLYD